MADLRALQKYASRTDLDAFPPSVLFAHSPSTLTIFDAYPKSMMHFLIIPRMLSSSSNADKAPLSEIEASFQPLELNSLKSLMKVERHKVQKLLLLLRDEAEKVKLSIQEEMMTKHGFTWPVWMGFHAVPSMNHLHLHVMSGDLISDRMKNKRHYNSFHPKLGFFQHLEDVVSWFDDDASPPALREKDYEPLLKRDLTCYHCEKDFKTIPKLKQHLQEEWDANRARAKPQRSPPSFKSHKRRQSEVEEEQDVSDQVFPPAKRPNNSEST